MNRSRAMWMSGAPALVLAAAVPGNDASLPEAVHAAIDMEGGPWVGDHCTGGDWTLGWKGAVAVESGPLADLLQSHTSFDTSQPNQEELARVRFGSKPVTCLDDRGAVAVRADVRTTASDQVHFSVGLASAGPLGEPTFTFSAEDLGVCHVQGFGHSMEYPVGLSVHTGTIQLAPSLAITLEDLQKGFNKRYTFDGIAIGAVPLCMGHELTRGTLTMRYKSGDDDPAVRVDSCLHLARGETIDVSAQGTPEGGQFRFSAAPATVLAVTSPGGSSARVSGASPGKADLTVEYSRGGKHATAALNGSVVDLVSINNGAVIPTLGIYGADGLRSSTAYPFPLRLDPLEGLVQMTATDETIASVVNTSSRVHIQPVKLGATSLQGKTLCGTPVGGPVRFEIVLCDENVKQQLRTKQVELKGRVDALVRRITSLTRDPEFDRAASGIKESTINMATKTAESIIGTLGLRQGQQVKFATARGIPLSRSLTINQQAIEVTGLAWDGINAWSDVNAAVANPSDWNAVGKAVASTAVLAAQNSAIALGKTYGEAYLAAEQFGKDLGIIFGALEQIEMLEPMLDEAIREYIRITTRLQFCESGKPQPPAPEPGPQDEQRPRPPAKDYTEIPVEDMPTEIPVKEEPEAQPPPIVDPPKEPGRQVVGLACRIQDLRAPGVALRLRQLRTQFDAQPAGTAFEDLADANVETHAMRAAELQSLRGLKGDVRTLQEMADSQRQQLETARSELSAWQAEIGNFGAVAAGATPPAQAALAAIDRARNAYLLSIGKAGQASLNLLMETDECQERMQFKFDQVRTRYN